MEVLHFRAQEWQSGPVMSASTFFERWRGLRGSKSDVSLLLHTNAVHGIGMDRPFQAIGLSADYRVVETRVVEPGRFVRFHSCTWVLEIPVENELPVTGQALEVVDV